MFIESFLLFCHAFICLKWLWNLLHKGMFPSILSPMVWKIWFIFNILLIFCALQLISGFWIFKMALLYIPLIFTFFLQSMLTNAWQKSFYQQFEFFVNALITQIKTGAGFRPAFKSAIKALPSRRFQNHFTEILETILFSKKLRPEFCFSPLRQMIQELQKADSSPQCLQSLENLRHHIRVQSLFRKKAQSALLQIRIQSLILLILYFCLFLFVVHKYGIKYINILLLSLILFVAGLFFLFQCGRRIKWTI